MDRGDKPAGGPPFPWFRRTGLDQLPQGDLAERVSFPGLNALASESSGPRLAWLGHGSVLISWNGLRLLVDPVFSPFIGPFPRRCPVPDHWNLIRPDAIFLTHAHMDHLDLKTLLAFPKTRLILPRGSQRFLTRQLREQAIPVELNQAWEHGGIRVHAVRARHGGWRYPWQRGCQAVGYVFTDGQYSVYVAGDSAYGDHFRAIGQAHRIQLAVLPIGAYSPRWFLKSRHMNPEEAIQAWSDLGADRVIPCHFGTYRLSLERLDEPLPRFARCAHEASCDWLLPIGFH